MNIKSLGIALIASLALAGCKTVEWTHVPLANGRTATAVIIQKSGLTNDAIMIAVFDGKDKLVASGGHGTAGAAAIVGPVASAYIGARGRPSEFGGVVIAPSVETTTKVDAAGARSTSSAKGGDASVRSTISAKNTVKGGDTGIGIVVKK